MRYTVCLMARTSGSSTASVTKRSTEVAKDSYGWCTSRSPRRMAAITVPPPSVSASGRSRGCVTGTHGGSRSSGKPGVATTACRSASASRPCSSYTCRGSSPSASTSGSSSLGVMPACTSRRMTSPKRRWRSSSCTATSRSSASSDTVKSASRVTRNRPVVQHLHAREQRAQVVGDDLLERDEGRGALERHEARQQLLGHLHPRHVLRLRHRIPQQHRQAQRQVGDVREVPPQPDGQRGEHGEDLLAEARVPPAPGPPRPAPSWRGCAGPSPPAPGAAPARSSRPWRWPCSRMRACSLSSVSPGVAPSGTSRATAPARMLLVQPGHPDHEELVQVARVDGAELQPLQQRHRGVLGQLEHPIIEGQPRQLPVEEELADPATSMPSGMMSRSPCLLAVPPASRGPLRHTRTPCSNPLPPAVRLK